MNLESTLLIATAIATGFVHTILGPDHYVPFIAMARAREWSRRKAVTITLLSGLGHVASSILIGLVGLVFGTELLKLSTLESSRGQIAGWLLLSFGVVYMIWGMRQAVRAAPLTHSHGGVTHTHLGTRHHDHNGKKAGITGWVLVAILVFGPCEPLIPLFMYPAARMDVLTTVAVVLGFSVACIGTMTVLVYASLRGISLLPQPAIERYSHALAGFAVSACGAAVVFLNL